VGLTIVHNIQDHSTPAPQTPLAARLLPAHTISTQSPDFPAPAPPTTTNTSHHPPPSRVPSAVPGVLASGQQTPGAGPLDSTSFDRLARLRMSLVPRSLQTELALLPTHAARSSSTFPTRSRRLAFSQLTVS